MTKDSFRTLISQALQITLWLPFLTFYTPSQAQFHTPVFSDLTGDELLTEVVSEYKPSTVLDYGEARDLMYGFIDNVNDSVSCVYSGHTLYLPPGVDPSTHLYMNGSSNGINAEHTYPRSKGADEENGNAYSDMHHLFPVRAAVNIARSNFPFGEIDDNETTSWYYLDQTQSNIPSTNIDAYSERVSGMFEPRESHKGNVARAIFYFYTMYKADALEADPDFFELQRETLCDWHGKDPVDLQEWERTFAVADYQDGKRNPFILDCTLAYRSYCQDFVNDCDIPMSAQGDAQAQIKVYPNPFVDRLHVTAQGEHTLQVVDMLGRVQLRQDFSEGVELDLSFLEPGMYLVWVGERGFRVLK
jgi:hypothetical protein